MVSIVFLGRNGCQKGYAVVASDWNELEAKAKEYLDISKEAVLEFHDVDHVLINEFRTPISNYHHKKVWVYISGEKRKAVAPYKCPQCGYHQVCHNCPHTDYPSGNKQMLPVQAFVIAIARLFD